MITPRLNHNNTVYEYSILSIHHRRFKRLLVDNRRYTLTAQIEHQQVENALALTWFANPLAAFLPACSCRLPVLVACLFLSFNFLVCLRMCQADVTQLNALPTGRAADRELRAADNGPLAKSRAYRININSVGDVLTYRLWTVKSHLWSVCFSKVSIC
jgi:hypothetical protein